MAYSLVLLPTFNERENLPQVVPRLSALPEVDVLVIDDDSPDGTGDLAEELRNQYPRLSVLHRKAKEGLGRAYVHGFREAIERGYSRVVTMDADLSHLPEDVPRLLEGLEEADVAVGSRHVRGGAVVGWPITRKLISQCGSLYARTLLRLPVRDATSGFRAYRAEALMALDLDGIESRGFVFQVEILRRILDLSGSRAVEVPIVFQNRLRGQSKLTFDILKEAAAEVAKLATRPRPVPLRRSQREKRSDIANRPKVAVIVPTLPEAERPEALEALDALSYPPGFEVIVARGRSPSKQRNEAVKESSAPYLLFLDDDSAATGDLLSSYVDAFQADPTLGAVGGPAESHPGSFFQNLSSLVLGETWVMGKSASRYRAQGQARLTDERELILCNLCVRREAFEEVAGFDGRLYPNEENEFLERLRARRWGLLYLPEARVRRPQRRNLKELIFSVHRYGMGRAAQARILPSRLSLGRLALSIVLVGGLATSLLGFILGTSVLAVPFLLYVGYFGALCMRLTLRAGLRRGILGVFLSVLVHGGYAMGVVHGAVLGRLNPNDGAVSIERIPLPDPQGESL